MQKIEPNMIKAFDRMINLKKSSSVSKLYSFIESYNQSEFARFLLPCRIFHLSSIYSVPVALSHNIYGELLYGSIVIQKNTNYINSYIDFKNSIESMILKSEWDSALKRIIEFEIQNGTSCSIKDLQIAIVQQMDGTAKQVAFSRTLESKASTTVLAYFLRFCSERNEDRFTISGLRRNLYELCHENNTSELVNSVVQWHGLHTLPDDEKGLADILAFEATGSIFDYYECFQGVLAKLISIDFEKYKKTIEATSKRITGINDRVIHNVNQLYTKKLSFTSNSRFSISNVLLELREISMGNSEETYLEKLIFEFLNNPSPIDPARRQYQKYGSNFYALNYFKALSSYIEHKTYGDLAVSAYSYNLAFFRKKYLPISTLD